MPRPPRPTPPPDLFGKDRPDRFLTGLQRFTSLYVPLTSRRRYRPRPPEGGRPAELTVARREYVAPD
ncbi:oxidoreductase, partial [Streptomyces sp. UH6]|nr:oxidoreductase [Streptomyces sp. UH6]